MKKFAFTVAEVTAVLLILGIVAVITIPATTNHIRQIQDKTKIKKALATYDSAVRRISSEQKISSVARLDSYIGNNNCANAARYFNIAKTGDSDCIFKTYDDIWWDVGVNGTMSKALVSTNDRDLSVPSAYDLNSYKAFALVTVYNRNKAAVIVDPVSGRTSGNFLMWTTAQKVYDYINNTNNGMKKCAKNAAGAQRYGCLYSAGSDNADCSRHDENGRVYNNTCIFSYTDQSGNFAFSFENCSADFNCSYVYKQTTVPDPTGEFSGIAQRTICDSMADCSNPKGYGREDLLKIPNPAPTDFGGATLKSGFDWYNNVNSSFEGDKLTSEYKKYSVNDKSVKDKGITSLTYHKEKDVVTLELVGSRGRLNIITCQKNGSCTVSDYGRDESLAYDDPIIDKYKKMLQEKAETEDYSRFY